MSFDNSDDDANLDSILTEVGEFGIFQILTYSLICIPIVLSSAYGVNFMISADRLEYR